jgi:hypothetical protein
MCVAKSEDMATSPVGRSETYTWYSLAAFPTTGRTNAKMSCSAALVGEYDMVAQVDINTLLFDDGMGGKKTPKPDNVQRYIGELGVGSVLNCVADVQWTAREYREAAIELNQVAAKYHRPPNLWGLDSVHGAKYIQGATLTPQPLNIATT